MRFAARLFLVMLLSLGLLLPKVSVMLAALTGAERVVFCDGHSLIVLDLERSDEGAQLVHADPCGLVLADLPPPFPGVELATPLVRPAAATRRRLATPAARPPRRHAPRAPPQRLFG